MKYSNSFIKALLPFAIAGLLLSVALAQTYQVQTNITDSQGKTVGGGAFSFTVSSPTTQTSNPTSSPTGAGSGAIPQADALPTFSSQPYESDHWLSAFKRDGNGFLIPGSDVPIDPHAFYWSDGKTPGSQPTDYTSFAQLQKAMVRSGIWDVWVRDGSVLTNGQNQSNGWSNGAGTGDMDDNFQIAGGSASHPIRFIRTGPNGFNDRTLPPPRLEGIWPLGGTEFGSAANVNYLEFFGLTFYADKRDPNSPTYDKSLANNGAYQQWAFQLRASTTGAQSDHLLFSDVRVSFYGCGWDFEAGQDSNTGAVLNPIKTVILDHCEADHCYGTFLALYGVGVLDLLCNDSCFAYNSWNPQVAPKSDPTGRQHDWYTNAVGSSAQVPFPADQQNRMIGTIFGAGVDSYKDAAGGLTSGCLFLADAIAGNPGTTNSLVDNCVVDGDNTEFDAYYNVKPGYALALTADGSAPRGWGFDFSGCPAATCSNTLFIDKPDSFNNGAPIWEEGQIAYNTLGTPKFISGPLTLKNVISHNWTSYQGVDLAYTDNSKYQPAPPKIINCDLQGMSSIPGVDASGIVHPNYVNPNATVSTYAASLGIPGVKDGPTWLNAAINNSSANFDPRLTAAGAIQYLQAAFQTKAN